MDNSDCCKRGPAPRSPDHSGRSGEIATLLVIASLIVIGVSTIASTFLSRKQTTSSSAKVKKTQGVLDGVLCVREDFNCKDCDFNCSNGYTTLGCFSDESKARDCTNIRNKNGVSNLIECVIDSCELPAGNPTATPTPATNQCTQGACCANGQICISNFLGDKF